MQDVHNAIVAGYNNYSSGIIRCKQFLQLHTDFI